MDVKGPSEVAALRAADDLHIEWVEDEAVVLHPGSGELHYLNPPAALFLALILEHGVPGATAELERRFPDADTLPTDLAFMVEDMLGRGLLVRD